MSETSGVKSYWTEINGFYYRAYWMTSLEIKGMGETKGRTEGEWFYIYDDGNFYICENRKYELEIATVSDEPLKENEIAYDSKLSHRPFEEREANAKFICLAVNSHDRLKEMLEKLIVASHGAMKTDANWWEDLQAAIDESSELLEELK